MSDWPIEQRRAYLLKLGFSKNKVNAWDDETVISMTSHMPLWDEINESQDVR